jgi:hypothetical protein
MLKDNSVAKPQPYSWSRVQLAWWTIIVLTCFITILIKFQEAPTLNSSTVILIGISAATIATARAIDISDEENPKIFRHQDKKGTGFFLDILSDDNGASIHRFQTIVFNMVFGIYFLVSVINHLSYPPNAIDKIMPVIGPNNLVLLGLSSATYAVMKVTENRTTKPSAAAQSVAENVSEPVEEAELDPAVG